MPIPVNSITDYMLKNQDLSAKMMQNSLNRLYAEPERQAQLNQLQAQSAAMPETLATQNAFRQASAQNLMNPFRINQMLSSSGKHVLEPMLLNALQTGKITQPQFNQLMQQGQGGQPEQGQPEQVAPPTMTSGQPIPEEKQGLSLGMTDQQIKDYYGAKRQKESSDPKTRERVMFATNIEKTLRDIGDPTFFNEFTGLGGQARLLQEKAKAAVGQPVSPEFVKWNDFVKVQARMLAGQIRQFYGESIQPEINRELQQMSNPTYWYANPELAYSQLNRLINLVRQEAQTYNKSLNAPVRSSEEALNEPLPPKSTLGEKKPTKTYSERLEKPILDLIASGGLTEEYYRKLTPEQQKAARKAMEGHPNG